MKQLLTPEKLGHAIVAYVQACNPEDDEVLARTVADMIRKSLDQLIRSEAAALKVEVESEVGRLG